jgi:hypothetical protein
MVEGFICLWDLTWSHWDLGTVCMYAKAILYAFLYAEVGWLGVHRDNIPFWGETNDISELSGRYMSCIAARDVCLYRLLFQARACTLLRAVFASTMFVLRMKFCVLQVRVGPFEKNDIFAIINALPAMAACMWGFLDTSPTGGFVFCLGLGVTLYGISYMFIHDGLVHRRFPVSPRLMSFSAGVRAGFFVLLLSSQDA